MSTTSQAVLEAALALSQQEREFVAERLLASLPPEPEQEDEAFLRELEERGDEARKDPSVLLPLSEVFKK